MTTSTLSTEPTAGVLQRLLADAAHSQETFHRVRDQRPKSAAEPHTPEYWAPLREVYLAVSPETGRLLYLLARSSHARSIVEFGTSFGVSTLHLAAAVRDNGGGRVIGTEFEANKAAATHETLTAAGLDDLVEIRVGDALETLRAELPTPIDLLFLDGAKPLYPDVLNLLEPSLKPDAIIVADNAARSPEYLDRVRNSGGYLSVSGLSDDVEVSLRLA